MSSYVTLDPLRHVLTGAKGGVSIERQNARHWLWEAATSFETPEFETNDIGRLTRGDGILLSSELDTRRRRRAAGFANYALGVGTNTSGTTAATARRRSVDRGQRHLAELLGRGADTVYDFRRQDMRLTRGGPTMERPARWPTR